MEDKDYEEISNQAVIIGQTGKNSTEASQYYMQEQEKGLVDIQLEVDSIKSDIYHLLKQDKLGTDDDGKIDWNPLENQSERTLSDWGVERIMQIIHFYINKNALLSNFSEEQIRTLMLGFMLAINNLILLKYQELFYNLSFKQCKEIIEGDIEKKKEMIKFRVDMNKNLDSAKLIRELEMEYEDNLERYIDKIKSDSRKEKIRDYELIIKQLEFQVLATLNRAWKGEERGSIRRHTNISELYGGRPQGTKKEGGMLSWGRN